VKPLIAVCLVLLVILTAYIAGETHRQTCIADHDAGCTVLPWSGYKPTPSALCSGNATCERENKRLEREAEEAARRSEGSTN
jgi:hypothetical protein